MKVLLPLAFASALSWCAMPAFAGDPIDSSRASVVGGTLVDGHEWNAVAALLELPRTGYGWPAGASLPAPYCSGVLIDATAVLTAGHCAARFASENSDWMVALGPDAQHPIDLVRTTAMVINPAVDLAVVLLERPASVAPVLLNVATPVSNPGVGVAAFGFGYHENVSAADARLRQREVEIIDLNCSFVGCVPTLELVAGRPGGGVCKGDSGGPLFVRTQSGPELLAVLSRALDGAGAPLCSDNAVFVRVDGNRAWLEQTLGRPLPRSSAPPQSWETWASYDDSQGGCGICSGARRNGVVPVVLMAVCALLWSSRLKHRRSPGNGHSASRSSS